MVQVNNSRYIYINFVQLNGKYFFIPSSFLAPVTFPFLAFTIVSLVTSLLCNRLHESPPSQNCPEIHRERNNTLPEVHRERIYFARSPPPRSYFSISPPWKKTSPEVHLEERILLLVATPTLVTTNLHSLLCTSPEVHHEERNSYLLQHLHWS